MANISASRDNNRVTTLLATSSVDGVTPVAVYADPVTHRLLTSGSGGGGTWGSITGTIQDQTDLVAAFQYKVFYTVGTDPDNDYVTDGTADQVQINQAMVDVNALGGGVVYVQGGTFIISDLLQIPSNVALVGAGRNITTIKAVNGYNPATASYGVSNACTLLISYASSAISNNKVSGITFDGNVQNITTAVFSRTIDIRGATNFRFVHNKALNGINWTVFFRTGEQVWIEDNIVLGGFSSTYDQNDGVHVRNSKHVFIRNNFIDTATAGGSGGDDCIAVGSAIADSTQDCAYVVIEGNIIASRSRGIEILTEGDYNTRDITITGNIIQQSAFSGIHIDKIHNDNFGLLQNITITGNDIYNFGTLNMYPADGIRVGFTTTTAPVYCFDNITITGNTIRKGNITATESCGIAVRAKGNGLIVSNNNMFELIGSRGIQIGDADSPVKDAIVSGNRIDLSTGSVNDTLGIFMYGTERGIVSNNEIYGNLAGTSRGISFSGGSTGGNDGAGKPKAAVSKFNNVFGNQIYNFDVGVEDASPSDFNRYSINQFNGVTTNYVIPSANSKVFIFDQGVTTSVAASGSTTIDSTTHATKGNIYINPTGGRVAIGTSSMNANPTFQVVGNTVTGRQKIVYIGDSITNTNALILGYDFTNNVGYIGAIQENVANRGLSLVPDGGGVGIGTTTLIAGGGLTISPALSTTGSPVLETITGSAHTTLTASTEASDVNWNLARTVQFATGALTTQRAVRIQAPTYGFVGASTITNAATVSISGAVIKGTNATITNSHGLLIEAGATSTVASSFGLTVNSPTGGTNNYSAQFLGGQVVVGQVTTKNTNPLLQVVAPTVTSQQNIVYVGDGVTNTNALVLGYDFTANEGQIGAITENVAWRSVQMVRNGGNVKLGGTANRGTTEGSAQLVIFNGTAPVGTLTNGASFYAAAGEMRVMDAGGSSTLLSPHDDENYWVFESEDTTNGNKLHIDVEKLLRFVNGHFGLDFVKGNMVRKIN